MVAEPIAVLCGRVSDSFVQRGGSIAVALYSDYTRGISFAQNLFLFFEKQTWKRIAIIVELFYNVE